MSFTIRHHVVAPLAVATLALGLGACGQDDPEAAPTVTVTATAQESVDPGGPTLNESEPMDETSPPEPGNVSSPSEAAPAEPEGPNGESGVLDVTVVGDQGILALQHAGSYPAGDAGPSGKKLIAGPGGCFALTNEGPPQLLVFPADARFVLEEGEPSATFGGTEHLVGRQLDVPTTAVNKTDVAGIPDRCVEGSDATVIVIN